MTAQVIGAPMEVATGGHFRLVPRAIGRDSGSGAEIPGMPDLTSTNVDASQCPDGARRKRQRRSRFPLCEPR
jgi:hypothetical protein